MCLKFYTTTVLLFFLVNVYGQKINNDTLINHMKSAITTFFIKEGVLDKSEVNGSLKFVYATEVVKQKAIGYDSNGIYRIGVLQSHSTVHILIKENLQFKIFDIKQIDETLKEVINYSVQNKISAEKMLLYLKEIMRMYDSNYCTPTVTRIN